MRYLKTNNRNWRKLCKGEIQAEQLQIDINKERVRDLEKPILFNTEMVKAILKGQKTCTRRIIKNKYENADIDWFENKYGKRLVCIQNDAPAPRKNPNGTTTHSLVAMEEIKKPYNIGDILYVRETWCDVETDFRKDDDIDLGDCKYIFKVDDNGEEHPLIEGYIKRWRPSIHMPKKASRIFLKVTDVRTERIQDITEEQIKKEGIREEFPPLAEDSFRELWDSTTKDYKWCLNPWVWVIEFERIEK
jgi:hypothetical protein